MNIREHVSPENFENLVLLENISCILEQELSIFEQNRKHKLLLKLHRIQARFFCFSRINLGRSKACVL